MRQSTQDGPEAAGIEADGPIRRMVGKAVFRFTRLTEMPKIIGARLDKMGGVLRCNTCGRTMPMKGAAEYLQKGWPECHGYTMEWASARPPNQRTPGPVAR